MKTGLVAVALFAFVGPTQAASNARSEAVSLKTSDAAVATFAATFVALGVAIVDASYVIAASRPTDTDLHNKILTGCVITHLTAYMATPILVAFGSKPKDNSARKPLFLGGLCTAGLLVSGILAERKLCPDAIPGVFYLGGYVFNGAATSRNYRYWHHKPKADKRISFSIEPSPLSETGFVVNCRYRLTYQRGS